MVAFLLWGDHMWEHQYTGVCNGWKEHTKLV